jgi:hypothetical protein
MNTHWQSIMLTGTSFIHCGEASSGQRTGYFGLAPLGTQIGDVVCDFHNGRALYVLRQVGEDYELVGTCFVLGLMDGEVMELVRSGTLAIRDVMIV